MALRFRTKRALRSGMHAFWCEVWGVPRRPAHLARPSAVATSVAERLDSVQWSGGTPARPGQWEWRASAQSPQGATSPRGREKRAVADAFAYWSAEAAWRVQQQRLERRQAASRRRNESLGGPLDADSRSMWARRVLNLDAESDRAWSEGNLRALRHAAARARQAVRAV